MSELQAEEVAVVEDIAPTEAEAGTVESGAELAADTGEVQEQSTKDSEASEKARQAINLQHKKFRDEERLRKQKETELADAQRRIAEFEASKPALRIPSIPDSLDYDTDAEYREAVKVRDEAIRQAAERDAIARQEQNTQKQATAAAERQKQESNQKKREAMVKRGEAMNIKPDALFQSGQKLVDYGITADLAAHLATHEDGPLILVHLASNPVEFDALNSMSPYEQAIEIESKIRPKVAALKPKPSQAPDPATTLSGNGAAPGEHPLIQGASFE